MDGWMRMDGGIEKKTKSGAKIRKEVTKRICSSSSSPSS